MNDWEKQCYKCGTRKHISKFVRDVASLHGRSNTCLECHAEHMRKTRIPTGKKVGRPKTRN